MDIKSSAKEYLTAKARFDQAWIQYWSTIDPLGDDRFFALVPILRNDIDRFCFRIGRTDGVDVASRDFYRRAVTGESNGVYTFDEALQFARAYERMYQRLQTALDRIVDECSDDGFSDLCDSLPLAGEGIVNRSLRSDPASEHPRRDGFADSCDFEETLLGLGDQWHRFIRRGENYIRNGLQNAARFYWLHLLRTGESGIHWNDDELQLLSTCSTPQ